MARPKQTLEEKLLIYQTKYKNAVQEIKMKDAEIERLTAYAARLEKDNAEWYEIAKKSQEQAKKTQEIAVESQRLANQYKTMAESSPDAKHRRKWMNRRPFSSKKD